EILVEHLLGRAAFAPPVLELDVAVARRYHECLDPALAVLPVPDDLDPSRVLGGRHEDHALVALRVRPLAHQLDLGFRGARGLRYGDDVIARHAVLLEHHARFTLQVQQAYAERRQLADAVRGERARHDHAGRPPLPVEVRGQRLARRRAARDDDDGVGMLERVLYHERAAHQAEQWTVDDPGNDHQTEDGEYARDDAPAGHQRASGNGRKNLVTSTSRR